MRNKTAMAAFMVACGLLMAACGGKSGEPTPTGTSTTPTTVTSESRTSTSAAPVSSSAGGQAFGPNGLGTLTLGMTLAQAKATGQVTSLVNRGICTSYVLKSSKLAEGEVSGYISTKYGLAFISAPPGARTPEGIGVGSTLKDVQKAYPSVRKGPNHLSATIPGNAKAIYAISMADGAVNSLSMILGTQDCVE